MGMVSLLMLTMTSETRAFFPKRSAAAPSPYELIEAVNALRASYGLPPYAISPILMSVAQSHADYMAATGSMSHTGIGGSSVTERLLAAGYPLAGDLSLGGFRSENITSGSESKTAQDAVNGWTGDAPHLNTMISPNLTEIGAGISVNAGRVYFVIDCALPTTNGMPQPAAATLAGGAPTGIAAGGVIIPVVVATPNADGDVIHGVKAGQTLWQLAISYETRIDEIKRLNNLLTNDIYPGSKLLIKKGVAVSPTAAVETATAEPTVHPTSLATITTSSPVPTMTATQARERISTSTNTVMAVAIGILALAFLGGGLFVRLGGSNKDDA